MRINADGTFAVRPPIGARFRDPKKNTVVIAATYAIGVVFSGGPVCNTRELQQQYTPC